LEGWCLYLDNMGGEMMESIAKQEPLIRRAMTVEDLFTKNEEERQFYELREKGLNDFYNAMSTAKKSGKLEGRLDTQLETARSMLNDAMAPELIAKFTGLSVEQVEALRKES
jgi:predicted transposase/invertase (TIGR01784 family)